MATLPRSAPRGKRGTPGKKATGTSGGNGVAHGRVSRAKSSKPAKKGGRKVKVEEDVPSSEPESIVTEDGDYDSMMGEWEV